MAQRKGIKPKIISNFARKNLNWAEVKLIAGKRYWPPVTGMSVRYLGNARFWTDGHTYPLELAIIIIETKDYNV